MKAWTAACLLLGFALALHAWHYDFLWDNTFIALRYVHHLLDGQGLVYNVGERVEGYTSFLWLLFLGGLGACGTDLLHAARFLSFCGGVGTLIAATLLARRLGPAAGWLTAAPALTIACSSPFACWALAGTEAPGYALCMLLSVLLALRAGDRFASWVLAGALMALTALMRPEGVLVGVVVCLLALGWGGAGRRRALAMAVPFAVPVLVHLVWRYRYYGMWLPNTFHARLDGTLVQGVRGLRYLRSYMNDFGGPLLYVMPLCAAFWRRDRAWWTIALVLCALTAGVVCLGGDRAPMYRLMVPLVPLWAVLLGSLLGDALQTIRALPSRPPAWQLHAVLALVVVFVGCLGIVPPKSSAQYQLYAEHKSKISAWTAVGKWLKDNAKPDDSVACVPIGAVGYYSELFVHDMLGLTDRHIARLSAPPGQGWAGHGKHDGLYVLSRGPTYLLLGNVRVLPHRLSPEDPNFVRVEDPAIEAREGDIYVPELQIAYEPAIVEVLDGRYLHYLRLRGEQKPGRWRHARAEPDRELPRELSAVLALPYLQGSKPAPSESGVRLYDRSRAWDGYNIYTSGHAPEAFLVDMEGRLLHRWHYHTRDRVWPGMASGWWTYWRRVHPYQNGDLLAIYGGSGVVRLDAQSQLLWAYRGENHHDLDVDDEGRIHVLGRKQTIRSRINQNQPILEDFVMVLSPSGQLLNEISLLDCFAGSRYRHLLDYVASSGDIFHTNTIEVLDGSLARKSRMFQKGNYLVSVRELDTVAIIDPRGRKVVWALTGLWKKQHQPTLLENGDMLLFDNWAEEARSRVIEFDPFTQEVLWSYSGSEECPFYSETCGSNQRLPNGNTLITESDFGRAFEVTPDGDVVWEFLNPHRAGRNDELIATLFELIRLPPDWPVDAFAKATVRQ